MPPRDSATADRDSTAAAPALFQLASQRRLGRPNRPFEALLFILLCVPAASHAGAPQCVDYRDYVHEIGSVDTPGNARNLEISGSIAYVADVTSGVSILDISNLAAPILVSSFPVTGGASDVELSGNLLYVAAGTLGGLQVLDVSNPTQPQIVGIVDTPGSAANVTVSGNLALVADGSAGLTLIDVSDPAHPVAIRTVDTPSLARQCDVYGTLAYVADTAGGLQIIDISNPNGASIVGSLPSSLTLCIAIQGAYAFLGVHITGVEVLDLSSPLTPVVVRTLPSEAVAITLRGTRAFVADKYTGLQIFDITDPTTAARIGGVDTPCGSSEAEVDGNCAFVACQTCGVYVMDVTNPACPPETGEFALQYEGRRMVSKASKSYVVDDGAFQIVDVSDPGSPAALGSLGVNMGALSLVANETHAFLGDPYLDVIDISNPVAPTFAARTSIGAVGLALDGTRLCATYGSVGMSILDVSNPATPVVVGSVDTPGEAYGIATRSTHAFVADGPGGLQVIDISNPGSPAIVGALSTLDQATDVVVVGSLAYVVEGLAGIQIVDISAPGLPVAVGHLDPPRNVERVAIGGSFAYLAAGLNVLVADVSNPSAPTFVGVYENPDFIADMNLSGPSLNLLGCCSGMRVIPQHCPTPTGTASTANSWSGLQAWPNPGRDGMTISIASPWQGLLRLQIFDLAGRRVRDLNGTRTLPGRQSWTWDGRDDAGRRLASGAYFARMHWPGGASTRRLTLLR